jgi:1,4-alpha-glucan branching enzyme
MDNEFISKDEIFLFNRGELFHSYQRFGAHIQDSAGIKGTNFVVWAPGSKYVCVVGDFNCWQHEKHPMRELENSGVWSLFIPGICQGQLYKYEIHTRKGEMFLKSDPYAFYSELRPATASVVYSLDGFDWHDQEWLLQRQNLKLKEIPLSIYEVHAGSWRRKEDGSFYNWRELAEELVEYVVDMNYTHIELLPLMEHPYDGSWGYQVTGYYSCTSRYGTPKDFMYFIDKCHQAGIGVILDWVPGHFCKDAHGLGRFNGRPLYEKREHGQWGTYNFDFAKTEVWSFLISNAVFWFEKYHLDGLRVDGVSSMLYLDYGREAGSCELNIYGGKSNLEAIAFLQKLNQVIFRYFPGVLMFAEESTDWPLVTYPTDVNGLGFNYKWNMGWMNDTLNYMSLDFSQRRYHHNLLTFSLLYAFTENFILPLSHDEVVHGKYSLLNKMPGDYWQKFAGLRTLLGFMICHPGKKLLFMGGELAQFIEWRYDTGLDWLLLDYEMHNKFREFVRTLNTIYLQEESLWFNDHDWSGFEWINVHNQEQCILVFCRHAGKNSNLLLVLVNFLPQSYEKYRIGVPKAGKYQEILNSDQEIFGGSGHVNMILPVAEKVAWHGREFSLSIKVPPLAIVMLKYCPE